ncbi:MAG: peptide chain release factor N(5)-glutamine methyltransferase [Chloracidobacterium sp.]|nr:peptide chain release factor N(5)-glutamine methyltransferase [Chloracidobacterium sp.]
MNISTALSSATEKLAEAGIAEPRRGASSLMTFILDKDAAFVIAHSEDELSANQKILFESCVRRRAKHEPFQYITRRQEFYGLEFEVTPDVLTPRPETEILVEEAIKLLSNLENPRFCEVGVGSGCISISILANVASATAIGVDISPAALKVAQRNAQRHNVAEKLTLLESDVFSNVTGKFDLIASNPPYIPARDIDALQAEVRDHEPHSALDGGEDGLAIIERIIRQAPDLLSASGVLLVEIGFDQSARVATMFDRSIWNEPVFLPDLQGIPRIVKVGKIAADHAVGFV